MSKLRFVYRIDIFGLTVRHVRSSLLLTPSHAKLLESAVDSTGPDASKKESESCFV